MIQNFKQSATEALPVVCIVDFGETEKCTFALPLGGRLLFDPMACDSKVAISIACLPSIASNVYRPANCITLYTTKSDTIQYKSILQLTLSVFLSLVRWFLNIRIISARVAFLPGILTPLVAREATSIISLNLGCSSA